MSFFDPQGPVAGAQRVHFLWIFGILAVFVAGPIFLLLPFFVWRFRYRNKAARYTPRWEYSRALEIMSWSGPILIVCMLAFFVWRDASRTDPYKPLAGKEAPLEIEVIGYDWKWLFIYPEQGIANIGTLALPIGRPVTLHITSATVMQSFFIPSLGSQIYAMGGMVTQLNLLASKPGASLGENTMYNGDGFHQQKFIANAMSPASFDAWVNKVRTSGMALDAATLQMVTQRGSQSELIAALPAAGDMQGDVRFSGVTKAFFPAVVRATLDGNKTLPSTAFGPAGGTAPTHDSNVEPLTGHAR